MPIFGSFPTAQQSLYDPYLSNDVSEMDKEELFNSYLVASLNDPYANDPPYISRPRQWMWPFQQPWLNWLIHPNPDPLRYPMSEPVFPVPPDPQTTPYSIPPYAWPQPRQAYSYLT